MTFRAQSFEILNQDLYDQSQLIDEEDNGGFDPEVQDNVQVFAQKQFELDDFPVGEKIKLLQIKQQTFFIITHKNNIMRKRLGKDNGYVNYQLPEIRNRFQATFFKLKDNIKKKLQYDVKEQKKSIEKLFMDDNGNAIFCTNDGLNFMLPINGNQIKHLHQIQSNCIKSCCFDNRNPNQQVSTVLLGTVDGRIVQLQINFQKPEDEIEKTIQIRELINIQENKPINNIIILKMHQKNLDMITLIIATTTKSIYQFHVTISAQDLKQKNIYSEENLYISIEDLFMKYYSSIEKIKDSELPQQNSVKSLIDICYDKNERPTSYLFTNGNALILIQLPNENEEIDNYKLKSFTFLNHQFGENSEEQNLRMKIPPQQIGLSLYHYYLLIKNNLYIFSRITQKVVHTIKFKNSKDNILKDIKNDCLWVYGSLSLDKIDLDEEENDVWRVYLEAKRYKEAYQLCASSNYEYIQYMGKIYGDDLLSKKKYQDAIRIYIESNIDFENVFQQLLLKSVEDKNCMNITESYLTQYLEKNKHCPNWECQAQIILAWVLQLKVEQIQNCKTAIYQLQIDKSYTDKNQNSQKEINLKIEQQQKKYQQFCKDLEIFLEKYKRLLNPDVTVQILQASGLIDQLLLYCEIKQNLYEVIIHHINEEHFQTALQYLVKVQNDQQTQIIYTYSHLFLKHETEAIVEILTKQIKNYDSTQLISSLFDIPKQKWHLGIKILEHSIQKQKCQDKSVHNTYLFFLAELKMEKEINQYLEKQKILYNRHFKILFTDVFALKICQANQLFSSQIQVFGFMKLYSEAVNLALQNDLLDDAKEIAKEVQDDVLRKKLWMEIVFYMIKNKDRFTVEEIVSLTDSESDQIEDININGIKRKTFLKIDEIIPHLDENMKIEQLQGKIQSSLQQYNDEIKELKSIMEIFSNQTDNCQKELIFMDEQYFTIDQNIKCEYCKQYIFQDETYAKQSMYIFPCLHKFHQNCYFKIVRQFFPLRPEFKEIIKELRNLSNDINLIKKRKEQKIKTFHHKKKNHQNEQLSFFEKYFYQNEEIVDTSQLNINKLMNQNASALKLVNNDNNSNLKNNSSNFRTQSLLASNQNQNNQNINNQNNNNIINNNQKNESGLNLKNSAAKNYSNEVIEQHDQFQKQLQVQAIQMGVEEYEQDGEDKELDNKLREIFMIKKELEVEICRECIMCGEIVVDLAFCDFDKKEELTWELDENKNFSYQQQQQTPQI